MMDLKEVIEPVKEILINDGFTCFGVGNIETGDEIGKYKYNTMMLHYANDLQKYESIFIDNGIVKNQDMIMAEDIINKNNPGECEIYTGKDGRNIYDIVDADNGIVKNEEMIMVEDIINKNNPGECEIYTGKDGRNIYDIVDAFKETFEEFYKAEQREE